jgi:hypothetical protein
MATTGLEFDLWVFTVECPKCRDPIVVPRQSPLGRFDGQADPSTDAWPAKFLCQMCQHGFVCTQPDRKQMLSLLTENSVLLRIEYRGSPSNPEQRGEVHTTFSLLFSRNEALRKARVYIQTTYGQDVKIETPRDYPW